MELGSLIAEQAKALGSPECLNNYRKWQDATTKVTRLGTQLQDLRNALALHRAAQGKQQLDEPTFQATAAGAPSIHAAASVPI